MNANWRDAAACQYVDPDLWFPEKGGSAPQAKLICAGCEVRAECLAYAVEYPERLDGVWGGLTENERRKLRRGQIGRAA